MTTTTEDFAKLVTELVSRIEAARVECQRMRTLLTNKHDMLATFEERSNDTLPQTETDHVIDATARFTSRQNTANLGA